jgi:hypothetical protein
VGELIDVWEYKNPEAFLKDCATAKRGREIIGKLNGQP